jgi:hypothetical protein
MGLVLMLAACSGNDAPNADDAPGPLTGDAAVAELRRIFDEYAVDGKLCEPQVDAISAATFALLDPTDGQIPAGDSDNPYFGYDTTDDGFITEAEFEAGEYAAAQENVNTDGGDCITFEELRAFQDL